MGCSLRAVVSAFGSDGGYARPGAAIVLEPFEMLFNTFQDTALMLSDR